MVYRYKVDALVLSRRHSGEADRIVRLFTRDKGIIRAMAKGVRKIPSHRGGHLEPYTCVHALCNETRVGTYIQAVETKDYYDALHRDKEAFRHAKTISIVIAQLFYEHDPQEELYDLLQYAWETLPAIPIAKRCILEATIILTALTKAGLMPDLRACSVCGARTVSDSVLLDGYANGWICLSCYPSFQGTQYSIPPRVLNIVRFIAGQPRRAMQVTVERGEGMQLVAAVRKLVADVVQQPLLLKNI